MLSVVPGYLQHTVPAPHAGQGQLVQAVEVKKPVHAPATHTSLLAQTTPQAPQLSGSLASALAGRHAPLQLIHPVGQVVVVWQTPLTHRCPTPQALPQLPQFARLALRFTQTPPHEVSPGRQVHAELRQACLGGQVVPHMPQFTGLSARSAHTPLQLVPEQEHMPLLQVSPVAQAVEQLPQ